jgi:hypothetical protein
VESARIIGERRWRIITHEVLPNLSPVVASSFLFTVLYGVGTYTALAFLALVNPDHWSWGSMLFWAQTASAEIGTLVVVRATQAGPSPCSAPRSRCSTRDRRVHQPAAARGQVPGAEGAGPG